MYGFRTTVDIAKGALATSQNSLAVAGHNISNVNTEGYTRQNVSATTATPVNLGRHQFGTGVTIETVQRKADTLLEKRLTEQRSTQAAAEGSIKYIDNLETIFDVQSDNNLNALMTEFWNGWHDLSNNPSGSAERSVVFESGNQLVAEFGNIKSQLSQLKTDIDREIETGVDRINDITARIAELNAEISITEAKAPANDQRDSRNKLVNELAGLMNINAIEQPDGFLTVMTDNGYPLVIGNESFRMSASQGRASWINTTGGQVDISDQIASGKISGLLTVKEEIIAKAETDLDALAKEIIWQVNSLHSSGAGTNYFSTPRTGTYAPEGGLFSALPFGNRIDYTKDFKMWVKDSKTSPDTRSIELDMGISTASVTNWGGAGTPGSKYRVTVTKEGTVGPGSDDPEITWERLAADGTVLATGTNTISDVNTLASGPATIDGLTFDISAGTLVAGNTFTINTSATGEPAPLSMSHDPGKRANSVLDTYTFKVVSGGGEMGSVSPDTPMVIEWSSGAAAGTITLDNPANLTAQVDGMELTFASGTLFQGDVFTIDTDNLGFPEDISGNLRLNNPSDWHWTVKSFSDRFNTQAAAAGARVTADVTSTGFLEFTPDPGTSFTFSDDLSEDAGVMAALGINTFFTGSDSGTVGVNALLEDLGNIAAAKVGGGESAGIMSSLQIPDPATSPLAISPLNNTLLFEENGNLTGITLDAAVYTSKTDLHSLAAEIQAKMNAASTLGPPATYRVEFNELHNRFEFSENNGSNLNHLNMLWERTPGTAAALGFQPTNELYIPPDGSYGVNNNETALEIAGIQSNKFDMARWTFNRGNEGFSTTVNTTTGTYFQDILSTLGIKASGIRQASEYGDIMVEKLTELRDSVSGVSVDEEMIKLMAFQQSYVAASKLITTADEMLQSLLSLR